MEILLLVLAASAEASAPPAVAPPGLSEALVVRLAEPEGSPADPEPPPVSSYRLQGRVFGYALLGEVAGTAAGGVLGFGTSLAWMEAGCSSHGGACMFPVVFGLPIGALGGTAVGGALSARDARAGAVAGSLVGGSLALASLIGISSIDHGNPPTAAVALLVPVALLPPFGAAVGAGFPRRRPCPGSG